MTQISAIDKLMSNDPHADRTRRLILLRIKTRFGSVPPLEDTEHAKAVLDHYKAVILELLEDLEAVAAHAGEAEHGVHARLASRIITAALREYYGPDILVPLSSY